MKLKLFFILIFVSGAMFGGYYFFDFLSSTESHLPNWSTRIVVLLVAGIVLQLLGHWLRAYKWRVLLGPIKSSDTGSLFNGLSVGFLFNVLLPFRAGELVRAFYVGDALVISKTVVFLSIVIERIVDGFLLGVCLLLAGLFIGNAHPEAASLISRFGLGILLVSILLAIIINVIKSENIRFLRLIHGLTSVFNTRISNRLRFMAWSGIHGTKMMISSRRLLWRYTALSLLMWLVYFTSVVSVVFAFYPSISLSRLWFTIQSTYAGVSAPSGPGYLGTFHQILNKLLGAANINQVDGFYLANWIVLVVPIALVGLTVLIVKKFQALDSSGSREALINKLHRETDISTEFSHFLDAYLKGDQINKVLSNAELEDKFKLVKSFKGGSNAHTMLVWQESELRVKKITLPQYGEKLRAQALWLQKHEGLPHMPEVVQEETTDDYYYFDLRYLEDYFPFFEYIHKNSAASSVKILINMLSFMDKTIYKDRVTTKSEKNVKDYIESKILGKITDAANTHDGINKILEFKKIKINGVKYENLLQIIERISKNKKAMQDLSTYEECDIHGDLTVDNLIVSARGDYLIIDPNNENQISAPVVDYGKLYQSLHSGYEFLIQLDTCNVSGDKINYEDSASHKYAEIYSKVDKSLRSKLSPNEYKTILFHEAVHYCRMLTYRVSINSDTAVVFYATAVRLFNEFIDQYE